MSKLVCPKCGNNRFHATAHVTATWVVDQNAEYHETRPAADETVVHRPSIGGGDLFSCVECSTAAEVVP